MSYRVGIDIGGTFTDFAFLKGSEFVLHKNLSTPADRSIGVMNGLKRLAELEGVSLGEFLKKCDAIVHGTTVADNTLIEMNGALTGLITTEGFRDEMEYRRGFKKASGMCAWLPRSRSRRAAAALGFPNACCTMAASTRRSTSRPCARRAAS